jgi:hypothetical protein
MTLNEAIDSADWDALQQELDRLDQQDHSSESKLYEAIPTNEGWRVLSHRKPRDIGFGVLDRVGMTLPDDVLS